MPTWTVRDDYSHFLQHDEQHGFFCNQISCFPYPPLPTINYRTSPPAIHIHIHTYFLAPRGGTVINSSWPRKWPDPWPGQTSLIMMMRYIIKINFSSPAPRTDFPPPPELITVPPPPPYIYIYAFIYHMCTWSCSGRRVGHV